MLPTVDDCAVLVLPGMAATRTGPEFTRKLARNDILFDVNDLKTAIYRVETGVLCISAVGADGRVEVVEHALAGDIVGLGFLERHAVSAHATVTTTVTEMPLHDIDRLALLDPTIKSRLDAAVEREFIYRRNSLVHAVREHSLVRLASLLCALSGQNGSEGRDPELLDNDIECAAIADHLSISLDALSLGLRQLKMRGLIEPAEGGRLRIKNLPRLLDLSNQEPETRLQSDLPSGLRKSW